MKFLIKLLAKIDISKVDISKPIANHLVGQEHTHQHRKIVGAGIMIVGVIIAQLAAIPQSFVLHILIDAVGYSIHGIGLIPFASSIEHKQTQN